MTSNPHTLYTSCVYDLVLHVTAHGAKPCQSGHRGSATHRVKQPLPLAVGVGMGTTPNFQPLF